MVNQTDVGQWVAVTGTKPRAVLEAVSDGKGRVCWGVLAGKRFEAWVAVDELEVVPGRSPAEIERTIDPPAPVSVAPMSSAGVAQGAWCGQHSCEPHDCFRLHYPLAYREDRIIAEAEQDYRSTTEEPAE